MAHIFNFYLAQDQEEYLTICNNLFVITLLHNLIYIILYIFLRKIKSRLKINNNVKYTNTNNSEKLKLNKNTRVIKFLPFLDSF